ncbi:MAG: putative toxin-antitoxin system toxin component, PIN family [Pseudomonadota bacterium]
MFDTHTIVSALLFTKGRLAWLRTSWAQGHSVPVIAAETTSELLRVLAYPKFQLRMEEQTELLAEFLPFAEVVALDPRPETNTPRCRDAHDQIFLELADRAGVDFLVTGDADLLVLNGQAKFRIIPPGEFNAILRNETTK